METTEPPALLNFIAGLLWSTIMISRTAVAAISMSWSSLVFGCSDSAQKRAVAKEEAESKADNQRDAAEDKALAEKQPARKPIPDDPDNWRSAIFAETEARQHSKDMPLRLVIASRFENRPISKDKVDYVIHEWSFLYGRSAKDYVLVSVDEYGARVNEELAKSSGKFMRIASNDGRNELQEADWESAANYPAIADWRVGSVRADEIAATNGGYVQAPGSPFGQGVFFLRMGNDSGKLIPFWSLPHVFTPAPDMRLIRADTGALVKMDPKIFK